MLTMIDMFLYYFSFDFVKYAFLVSIFISLSSALIGVPLVLKRYAFIGDSLSHVAFGALAIATVFDIAGDMIIVLPITIGTAIFLLQKGESMSMSGDSFLAVISVGSLAIGYLLISIFSSSANVFGDVCTTLFGSTSILTLSRFDVGLSIILSLVLVLIYIIFYHKIFAITFDDNFASATGLKTNTYNRLIAIVTAIIIVLAIKLVGTLLISALLILPALTGMKLVYTFKGVVIVAVIVSIISSIIGITVSILGSLPVGPAIVTVNIILFLLATTMNMTLIRR